MPCPPGIGHIDSVNCPVLLLPGLLGRAHAAPGLSDAVGQSIALPVVALPGHPQRGCAERWQCAGERAVKRGGG